MRLEEFSPKQVGVTATMDNFWLTATQEMRIATSGKLTLGGTYPALRADGSIRLTEGMLNLDDTFFTGDASLDLDDRIVVDRGDEVDEEAMLFARKEEAADSTSELMAQFNARVEVDLNNNLKLDMSYPLYTDGGERLAQVSSFKLNADMTGELDALYRGGDIALVGDVELTRGEATVLSKDFEVEAGSEVRFTGGDYANPFLDIQARYRTSQYGDVVLNIGQTALDPSFGYTSENATQDYDQSDLLSILLFGRPASSLADSEGEAGQAALSAALSTVGGSVSSALGGTVVDQVDWDPDSGIRIGKALSEKLFLVYDRNSDPEDTENVNQVTLEWLISRRLYAEFMTGDRAQSSADIYFRRTFGEAGTVEHNPQLMPGRQTPEPEPAPGAEEPAATPASEPEAPPAEEPTPD